MTTARTPGVAFARALRSLGLVQGQDFRVSGRYEGTGRDRERTGTHTLVSGSAAVVVITNTERFVAAVAADGGWSVRVVPMIGRTPHAMITN